MTFLKTFSSWRCWFSRPAPASRVQTQSLRQLNTAAERTIAETARKLAVLDDLIADADHEIERLKWQLATSGRVSLNPRRSSDRHSD